MQSHELDQIANYYLNTALDYEKWSRELNMHFGYWRWGLNPFKRERMLEEMNSQVARCFPDVQGRILDLGCGFGATMRSLAASLSEPQVLGVTLVAEQARKANELNRHFGDRLLVKQGNYLNLPLPDQDADGAYALESSCYAPGVDKEPFLRELHRILKPGAPFCIADGFTKTTPDRQSQMFRKALAWSGEGWVVKHFGHLPSFANKLDELGFRDLEIREVSWNIGPTALHSPFLALRVLLQKWIAGKPPCPIQWRHIRSGLVAPLVGLLRAHFGYFIITGRR